MQRVLLYTPHSFCQGAPTLLVFDFDLCPVRQEKMNVLPLPHHDGQMERGVAVLVLSAQQLGLARAGVEDAREHRGNTLEHAFVQGKIQPNQTLALSHLGPGRITLFTHRYGRLDWHLWQSQRSAQILSCHSELIRNLKTKKVAGRLKLLFPWQRELFFRLREASQDVR